MKKVKLIGIGSVVVGSAAGLYLGFKKKIRKNTPVK